MRVALSEHGRSGSGDVGTVDRSTRSTARRLIGAALVVVLSVPACGDDGATDDTAQPTSTRATDPSTTTAPQDGDAVQLVLASDGGVHRIDADGDRTTVSDDPAARAFGVGERHVVFQDADATARTHPPTVAGPVRAWSDDEVRVLPAGSDATRIELLDAGIRDGSRVALVAERFGEAAPDDTFEELVLIDLDDHTRTALVRRPAWESMHLSAHLLPDGDVVGLVVSEAQMTLHRWTASVDGPLWTAEVGIDVTAELAVRDGEAAVVESSFDEERDFAPVLEITGYDAQTGDRGRSQVLDVLDLEGTIGTGLFCGEWLNRSELACARGGGPPLAISVEDGSVDELPGDRGAIPTVARTG